MSRKAYLPNGFAHPTIYPWWFRVMYWIDRRVFQRRFKAYCQVVDDLQWEFTRWHR